MNILTSVNKKYIRQLNVLLNSIAYSNKEEKFNIYVLNKNLDKDDLENITVNLDSKNFSVIDVKIPDSEIDTFPVIEKRYPVEIYFRLFASDYLPSDIDRILYLDCDTVVINDLNELYNMDFEDNYYIAATHISKVLHKFNEIRLNIQENEPYVNTGVLLINLKELRKIDVKDKIIKFIEKNQKRLLLPDQDIIVSLFGNKIKLIDELKYNLSEIAWYKFNITSAVQKWTDGSYKNNGVIFVSSEETDKESSLKEFVLVPAEELSFPLFFIDKSWLGHGERVPFLSLFSSSEAEPETSFFPPVKPTYSFWPPFFTELSVPILFLLT